MKVEKYNKNIIGIDYVCGDIHGCFMDLENQLNDLKFDTEKDRLFSVGDLTDRGNCSPVAMEYLKQPWFSPVMGNHEDMILQCYKDKTAEKEWHYQNGGDWTKKVDSIWMDEYISLVEKLPLIIQVGEYAILHSAVNPEAQDWNDFVNNITDDDEYSVMWYRSEKMNIQMSGIKKIYAGHTIHSEPVDYGILQDIDTGAFLKYWSNSLKGKLTIKIIGD